MREFATDVDRNKASFKVRELEKRAFRNTLQRRKSIKGCALRRSVLVVSLPQFRNPRDATRENRCCSSRFRGSDVSFDRIKGPFVLPFVTQMIFRWICSSLLLIRVFPSSREKSNLNI